MKIQVRLDDKIAEELKFQAKQNGITLSELCRRKLTQENQPVQHEQVGQVAQSVNIEKMENEMQQIKNLMIGIKNKSDSVYQLMNDVHNDEKENNRLLDNNGSLTDYVLNIVKQILFLSMVESRTISLQDKKEMVVENKERFDKLFYFCALNEGTLFSRYERDKEGKPLLAKIVTSFDKIDKKEG